MKDSATDLTLYGYWRSSASWRARWALELKQIAYRYIPVSLLNGENKAPAHLARNPMGAVPVLEVGGKYLSESLAIIQWLEETFPDTTRLFPTEAWPRAQVRALCEIINSAIAPLQAPRAQKIHSDDPVAREKFAVHFIREGLKVYEGLAAPLRGQWSVGNHITAADLFLIPQIYNAVRYKIPVENEFPALWKMYLAALNTEACAKASPERQIDAPKS